MTTPPPLPPPQPKLRRDGTVKGPAAPASVGVLGVGIVLFVAALVVLVPAFLDGISGPRFTVPGQRQVELDAGTWTIYEFTLAGDDGRAVGFGTEAVSVTGPAPVEVWEHTFGSESITRDDRTYVGAVRFRIAQEGAYTIAIGGEPGASGEVLVARPVSDLFQEWRWFLAVIAGGLLIIGGSAMWIIGATNRRVARTAGHDV